MKKIILIFILCVFVAKPCFAQNNVEAMRFLTVNALMQYGQKLYDRGDFDEACAVFNHVLIYDGHQAQALQYLKEMGHSPAVAPSPIVLQLKVSQSVPAPINIDVMDTESLKEAIEAKKRSIEKLRTQIEKMRATIASQSTEK